ncbi:MAG: hypothetical protein K8Q91_02220 [Candidatus Vogelbacteria bacterium]|nr:hypothetical protein [Candidatus Vogelbacteria bacterium]
MSHRKFNKLRYLFSTRFFLGIFFLFLIVGFSTTVYAAYERFAPGTTATIGEFVYEDDFTPSTEDCVANIYDPSGGAVVTNGAMSEAASGWHWYDYSIPAIGPEGIWPASMSCGTGGELVKVDKTFSVGAVIVSSSTISSAVWASSTRTLTDATINGGSLATTDELNSNDNILYDTINNASSSLFATLPGSIFSLGLV